MRKCINVILICLLLSNSFLNVKANDNIYFYFTKDKGTVYQDDEFILSFAARSKSKIEIGTFKLVIDFDEKVVDFKKIEFSDVSSNEVNYVCDNGKLTIVYLINSVGIVTDPSKDVNLFDIKFKTKKNARFGETNIKANFDGLGDIYAKPIDYRFQDSLPIEIKPPKEYDCTLKYLETSEGELMPEFSPNVTNYSLNVTYEVDRIDVYAEPNDLTATVKVSRKTLQKAGVPTVIKVTVTSEDRSSKLVYQITVNRSLKENNEDLDSKSSKSSSSSKGKSSGKTKTKSNNNETESLAKNNNSSRKSIHIKDNDFAAFLTGMSLIIAVVGVGFALYMYKKNKCKTKDE